MLKTTFNPILALGALFVVLLGGIQNASSDQVKVESEVTDVTLYRTQAMVTRTLSVELPAGATELLVSDLPANIVPDSLFAEGNEQLEVRAVQFRTRAVATDPRKEVQEIRDELEVCVNNIKLLEQKIRLITQQNSYLDKLEGFVAPTVQTDLAKGVLDAEALKQITQFDFEKRKELLEEQFQLKEELNQANKQQSLLSRKLSELTNQTSRDLREALIFIQKKDNGAQQVRLNYLVNGCSWSPSYAARGFQNSNQVRIEYNGLIQQMSGENWDNVNLTLSSASPALSATGPGLAPFRVTLSRLNEELYNGPAQQAGNMVSIQGKPQDIKALLSQQRRYNQQLQNSINIVDNRKNNWGINDAINKLSCAELTIDSASSSVFREEIGVEDEQPAMNYVIASPVSLASRRNQQMVRILSEDLDSESYHVATPILTSYVYREAQVTNSSDQDLLGGPMTVYLDNRFVGRSEVPSVTRGQTFVIGFGADSQIRTRRELVDRQNSFTGGNRETKIKYRLVVENYKTTPVSIRMFDRVPVVNDEANIRVTMLPMETKLSQDETYQRLESGKGILRWDSEIPADAVGADAAEIEYGFTIEHDRQYQVSLPLNTQEQQEEFDQLQNIRTRR